MDIDGNGFMTEIRDAYVSDQSNQFLLTGNVLDLQHCPWVDDDDPEAHYVTLPEYLSSRLGQTPRLIIKYNIAHGIEFASPQDQKQALDLYLTLFSARDRKEGVESFNQVTSRSSAYILASLVLLKKLCTAGGRKQDSRIAVIIEHVESILPDNPVSQMNDQDRQRLIFFKDWLTDPGFVASNHLLFMVSETASALNSSVRSLPHMINIHIPLPEEDERKRFIRWRLSTNSDLKLGGSQKSFAQLSAGMTLLGIEQTMRLAQHTRGKLDRADFMVYLNRLLTNRIGDHIEMLEPQHTFDDVIGNATLKTQLARVKAALTADRPDIAPVGILVAGPNGVGKTYVMLAWAGECGRTVIMLKNLRGSYFGQTDQIFEKIRNVLEVLGNVIVIVDEADTVFAKPGANTHETEQRLFGNVIKMMGDPKNRSRIVWVLMTARPDNLAPDLKRSGRCGLHLPIFDPEGADREAFVDFVLSRLDLKLADFSADQRQVFMAETTSMSAADFRELLVELDTEAMIQKKRLTPAMVLSVLADYVPGDVSAQRRLQTFHALLHCSKRSLIPPSLRDLTHEEIQQEIARLSR